MNTTAYKGFTITQLSGRCYVTVSGSKSRAAAGFNPDGYATLGNAKGAITKHEQAQALRAATAVKAPAPEVMTEAARRFGDSAIKAKAATNDDKSRARVVLATDPHGPDGYKLSHGKPVTLATTPQAQQNADRAQDAHMLALFKYYGGFNRAGEYVGGKDIRSRNKREGVYNGYTNGQHERALCRNGGTRSLFSRTSKYYAPTRKARKALKMEGVK